MPMQAGPSHDCCAVALSSQGANSGIQPAPCCDLTQGTAEAPPNNALPAARYDASNAASAALQPLFTVPVRPVHPVLLSASFEAPPPGSSASLLSFLCTYLI
jgi:hypothetical protein